MPCVECQLYTEKKHVFVRRMVSQASRRSEGL